MKDINITSNEYLNKDDNDIFNDIIEEYNINNEYDISKLWYFANFLDLENDDIDEDDIININNMNLSYIKKYSPNIYNTCKYEIDEYPEYNEEYKDIFKTTLSISGNVLKSYFNDRFFNYINEMEGGELSGNETDEE